MDDKKDMRASPGSVVKNLNKLQKTGLKDKQSKAFVEVSADLISSAIVPLLEQMGLLRGDVKGVDIGLRSEIKNVRAEVKDVRTEVKDSEVRLEIRFDSKIDNVEARLRADIRGTEKYLWIIFAGMLFSLFGMIVALGSNPAITQLLQ